MAELRLFEASPAWTLEGDALVGFDLSFTRGLALCGADIACQADDALEALSGRLADALCAVPENAIVRFHSLELCGYDDLLNRYAQRLQAEGRGAEVGAYVARKKIEQCQQLSLRRRELYCFVSTPAALPFSGHSPALLGRRAGKMLARAVELHSTKMQESERLVHSVARAFGAAGLSATLMPGTELFACMWRMANPIVAQRRPPPSYRPESVLRSQLFASGLINNLDSFERDGCLNRVITLRLPPRQLVPTQALELQSLPFVHHISVVLRRVSDADALRRVETNRRQGHELDRALAKLRGAERHAAMPDHLLIEQRADVNDVLARIARGERLFEVAVHVWLAARTEDELLERTELVMARLRACGRAEGAIEELRGRFAFLSMLPGHHALIGERFHPFLASRACDLLPIYSAAPGAHSPTSLLTTRSGELVGFEPFMQDLPAWNATIAGGTGSGKSFTARTLLTGWLASGGRVFVATRGRDYHRYADVLDGAVQDVALDDPHLALGPFPSPRELSAAGAEHGLEHLASIIGVMASDSTAPLDRQSRRLIYQTTQSLFAGLGGNAPAPCFTDWLAAMQPLAQGEPELRARAQQLEGQLRFWLDGPYGPAFCRNRPADNRALCVWNLEPITDADTQGVALAVLSGLIARSVARGPTVIVLDEVWSLFKSSAGASLVETLYRTVRKQGSAIWTISQSMNDYVALPEATRSAILNNSPIRLFLAHDASELDLVASTFKLTAREADLLKSLRAVPGRYSELLAFFGSRRQVLRLVPTAFEYWLATSHPKDASFEALAMQVHPDLPRLELLKRLARRYPHGAVDVDLAQP